MEEYKDLFIKYLDGQCTVAERQLVHDLLDTEEGNRMLFRLFEARAMEVRKQTRQEDPAMRKLTTDKQRELLERIKKGNGNNVHRPFLSRTIWCRIGIAAAFVGIIILTRTLLWNNRDIMEPFDNTAAIQPTELTNPDGVPRQYQLPDGTQVWLAAGSTLKYTGKSAKECRSVELTGEAFFNVVRDEEHPFTIHSGEMETRVLGTSFKITAFAGQEQEVAVATGKVSVNRVNKSKRGTTELALLTCGTSVRYNPATGETTQGKINPQSLEEWKSGKLSFNKMPMKLVAKLLEKRYGIEIRFANQQISECRVSGSVNPEEPVTTILRLLGRTGKFRHESKDGKLYIIH